MLWPINAWTPQDPWRCVVVSGTKTLAADSLSPVSCEVGPQWIRLVCSAHLQDAWLDWDLGNLEAKSTPWTPGCVPQTIPEPFLQCGMVRYPAKKRPLWNTVSMKGCTWSATLFREVKVSQQIVSQSITLPLLAFPLPRIHSGPISSCR